MTTYDAQLNAIALVQAAIRGDDTAILALMPPAPEPVSREQAAALLVVVGVLGRAATKAGGIRVLDMLDGYRQALIEATALGIPDGSQPT
jgi:hypothetical protein